MRAVITRVRSASVEIGGKVMSVATLIIPVYAAVSLLLQPVVYLVYRKSEVRN